MVETAMKRQRPFSWRLVLSGSWLAIIVFVALFAPLIAPHDPLLDDPPNNGRDLPFATAPRAASLALIQRWTGVQITEQWYLSAKPTYIVDCPI